MNAWLFRCIFLLVSVSACVNSPDAVSPPASGPLIPASISERIVFVSDQGTSLLRQIYVMRSDGSGRKCLTIEQSCFASSSYLNRNTFNVRDLEPGISSDASWWKNGKME